MEYTAVRYPTKEYRQYRPGSKGLNVHYRAFREQFYGNKAIIKHSFRDVNRNPSVGQYTDQRGIPTYAYKIPNGKMYKTAPLMARIPRGGSVPRVVGSLGDVQGQEFFTEGTYQPPSAPGQTLNSPFLFGKVSQTLQDATAQYQAQTGKPVDYKVIQSQPFRNYYTEYVKNSLDPKNRKAPAIADAELTEAVNNQELEVVNQAFATATTPTTPAADTRDTPMMEANYETLNMKGPKYKTFNMDVGTVVATRFPKYLELAITIDDAKNTFPTSPIQEPGNRETGYLQNNTIATSSEDAVTTNPGAVQVLTQDSLAPMRQLYNSGVSLINNMFNTNTEQQITEEEDTTSEFDDRLLKAKANWSKVRNSALNKVRRDKYESDKAVAVINAATTLKRKGKWNEIANKLRSKRDKEGARNLEIKDRVNRLLKPDKKGKGPLKKFVPKSSNLKRHDDFMKARKLSIDTLDQTIADGMGGLTVPQLKAKLEEHKIPFDDKSKKEVLYNLLRKYYEEHENYEDFTLGEIKRKKAKKVSLFLKNTNSF